MTSKIAAVDLVAGLFEAIGERGILAEGIGSAKCSFITGGDVIVPIVVGVVEQKNEEVGMTLVAEAGRCALPKLLLDRAEPRLRALP